MCICIFLSLQHLPTSYGLGQPHHAGPQGPHLSPGGPHGPHGPHGGPHGPPVPSPLYPWMRTQFGKFALSIKNVSSSISY